MKVELKRLGADFKKRSCAGLLKWLAGLTEGVAKRVGSTIVSHAVGSVTGMIDLSFPLRCHSWTSHPEC